MLVTLLTVQLPMSWLKADAPLNMDLYADTQHKEWARKGGRGRKDTPSGHNTRLCGSGSTSEWVMC